MDLTIVTTVYNSSSYINSFYHRISRCAEKITGSFEIIFVNDGSFDDSSNIILSLSEKDEKVRLIELSKNFGHHKAIGEGLKHASGDLVFLIDVDLEERPELLTEFYEAMKRSKSELIYGVQVNREGPLWERFLSFIYYKIFNFLAPGIIKQNSTTARLMTKKFCQSLMRYRELEYDIRGLCSVVGLSQLSVCIRKNDLALPSYNFIKRCKLAIDTITSFAIRPLLLVFMLGCIFIIVSFITIILYLFLSSDVDVSIFLSLLLLFMNGVVIFSLGILALYIKTIIREVKHRPRAIIQNNYLGDKKDPYGKGGEIYHENFNN